MLCINSIKLMVGHQKVVFHNEFLSMLRYDHLLGTHGIAASIPELVIKVYFSFHVAQLPNAQLCSGNFVYTFNHFIY